MRTIALLAGVALMAVVVPAQAAKPTHKAACLPPAVSYEVSGTLTTPGALTASGHHRYSGTLTVHVTKANRNAKADKGTTKTYTLTNAKVTSGHGVNKTAPAAGSRANLKGTITRLPKKCSTAGFTPTITIKKVELHAAHK